MPLSKTPPAPSAAKLRGRALRTQEVAAVARQRGPVKSYRGELEVDRAGPVAVVDEAACEECGACQAICPTEAIVLTEAAAKVNGEACLGCGACVEVCPSGAITLT